MHPANWRIIKRITQQFDWKLQQLFGACMYFMNIKRETNSFFNRPPGSRTIWDTAHKSRLQAAPLSGAQFYYWVQEVNQCASRLPIQTSIRDSPGYSLWSFSIWSVESSSARQTSTTLPKIAHYKEVASQLTQVRNRLPRDTLTKNIPRQETSGLGKPQWY